MYVFICVFICVCVCACLQELFSGHCEGVPTHYGMNLINQKIPFPPDGDSSDDQLSFLPYFLYYYSLKVRPHPLVTPPSCHTPLWFCREWTDINWSGLVLVCDSLLTSAFREPGVQYRRPGVVHGRPYLLMPQVSGQLTTCHMHVHACVYRCHA